MTRETLIDRIHDRTDLRRTFREIRDALELAASHEDLTELYKQSVYMILMTHSSPLDEQDRELKRRRQAAEKEFSRTVRLINRRAKKIGVQPEYSEDWQSISTNGYEAEKDSLLEARKPVGIVRR